MTSKSWKRLKISIAKKCTAKSAIEMYISIKCRAKSAIEMYTSIKITI